ncbi:TadE/TadG family type IV pilus assembly protein [Bradyrhizobium sp.]|uniref:TadE/TadG family type IV pilus assembly protein n=1 Tax=Bradyrhizobium sp. TaxID=376 RepID=UPI003C248BE9
MRKLLQDFRRSGSATAAIEFAFILPVLLMMFAAVVEAGRLFQVYDATNRLATQYAIVFADCSDIPAGTCNTELAALGSSSAIANIVPQLQTGHLSVSIFQVSMSGTTPTVVYAFPAGATLTPNQTLAAQGLLSSNQSGVVVTATYSHSLEFFQTLMSPYLSSVLTPSYTAVQLKG